MNRFAIDEDAAFEIVDIIRLPGIHKSKTEKPLPIHIICATNSHLSDQMNIIDELLPEFQID